MSEIMATISKPSWWIAVFLAGVIVNLLSAYLKPLMDKRIAHFSVARQQALKAKDAVWAKQVAEMAGDMSLIIEAKLDMINFALKAIVSLALAIIVSTAYQGTSLSVLIGKYVVLLALMVFSIYCLSFAIRIETMAQEAKSRRSGQREAVDRQSTGAV